MARHYLLAIPAPDAARYADVTADLRSWMPGLRAEQPGTWHIHLARLPKRPWRFASRLRMALQDVLPVTCRVRGIGAGPDVRATTQVWANVEAPGLASLARWMLRAARLDGTVTAAGDVGRVPLAHMPRPCDLRSFLGAHRGTPFAAGWIDRVVLLEASVHHGAVRYRELASLPFGVPARPPTARLPARATSSWAFAPANRATA